MAYIPSARLAAVLEKARVGLWIDTLQDARIALVCKLPETAIKGVLRGCPCSLTVSVLQVVEMSVLCLGFQVQDEPEHPFTAIAPFTLSQDQGFVMSLLTTQRTTLHCLNEFNHPALSAWCAFDAASATPLLDALRAITTYVLTPDTCTPDQAPSILRRIETALDLFQREVYRRSGTAPPDHVRVTGVVPLQLVVWRPQEVIEVGPTTCSGPLRIDDVDEGAKLEASLLPPIEALYPGQTYRSPTVLEGPGRERELTDILAFDDQGICLVEAKALSVLATEGDRTSARRASAVMKQIRKALNQLRGALSNIRSQVAVYGRSGKPITWSNRLTAPAHAIVLLSEMYAFLDWRSVATEIVEMSESERHRALFHVIDILELAHIARRSKDAAAFNGYLLQRWVAVKEKGTAYGRVTFRDDLA